MSKQTNRNATATADDSWPRPEELKVGSMLRLQFTFIPRAWDAAIEEDRERSAA